jgi:hypothetical protein
MYQIRAYSMRSDEVSNYVYTFTAMGIDSAATVGLMCDRSTLHSHNSY